MPAWVARARFDYQWLTQQNPFRPWVESGPSPGLLTAHVHEGFEMGVVLAGREEHLLEGGTLPGDPGHAWLCSAWEPHGWLVKKPGTESVVVMFLPEFVGEERIGAHPWQALFAAPPTRRLIAPAAQERERVLSLGRELRREIEARAPNWETAVRLALLQLFLLVSRHWQAADYALPAPGARPTQMSRITPAVGLLHGDPTRAVKLSEAAHAAGLSRSRFAALFRHLTGMSFGEFCLQVRVSLAREQLIETELPVEEIATASGFANASHLHRVFVRYHRCTPGQYRREHRRQS